MKKTSKLLSFCIVALCLLISGNVFGQGEANVWYFGGKTGLTFNGGPSPLINGTDMSGSTGEGEGCTTMCDPSGNLLFYSNGETVWDKNGATMSNGTGLFGSFTSAQSAVAIPRPGSVLTAGGFARYYYIFTVDYVSGTHGLCYSEVDMNGNGGLGIVIAGSKNTSLISTVCESMVAIPHFNGTDTWIVVRSKAGSNTYYPYQVSSSGVTAGSPTSAGHISSTTSTYQMAVNPCYNKIGITYHNDWNPSGAGSSDNGFEIVNFNNNTGAVTNANLYITNVAQKSSSADYRGVYGIDWSPSGRYLFVSELVDNKLYQYDVYAGGTFPGTVGSQANISASKQTLGTGSAVRTGHVQLGPNKRIYTAQHVWASGNSYVGEVANPDVYPATWNTTAYSYSYSSNSVWVTMGLPTISKKFVNSSVDISGPTPLCANSSGTFSFTFGGSLSTSGGVVQDWDWGDGSAHTTSSSSSAVSQSHTYTSGAGSPYTITLVVKDVCGYSYTGTFTVVVNSAVTPTVTPVQNCASNTVTFTASGGSNYGWWDAATAGNLLSTSNPYVATGVSPSTCSNVWVQAGVVVNGPYTSITSAPTTFPPPNDLRLYMSAVTDVDITSITIRPTTYCCNSAIEGKNITVRLYNSSGVQQGSAVSVTTCTGCAITVGGNPTINQVIPVAFTIPAGSTNWYIAADPVAWSPGFLNQTKSTVTQTGVISFSGDNSSSSMGPFYNVAYSGKTINSCNLRVAASSCCPSPVTWLDFTAKRQENKTSSVLLDWSTAAEQDSKTFYVQRSSDGLHFETIGVVGAAGYSTSTRFYQFEDTQAPVGNLYYRLLQEDYDGATIKSRIVYLNGVGSLNLNLVPNPGNGSFTITGLSPDVKLNVTVYSITGQSIFATIAFPGEVIDLDGLAKGLYIVKIISGSTEQSIRYINQ